MKKYTINELEKFDSIQLINLLKEDWGIQQNKPIEVIGELNYNLSQNKCILKNISLVNGKFLKANYYTMTDGIFISSLNEIPIDLSEIQDIIKNRETAIITCELELVSEPERKKNKNIFELSVVAESIKVLEKLKYKNAIFEFKKEGYIQNSILNYIKKINKEELENSIQNLSNKLKYLKENFEQQEQKLKIIEDKEKKSTKTVLRLEENKKNIILDIKSKKDDIEQMKLKIEEYLKEEQSMGKKLEKLREFVKDKADTLLALGFIDKNEYNNICMINDEKKSDEKFVDFEKDLLSDKQKVISHIQAYLFYNDIIYPRYIIEDFFALIQTNDLIILAGESGSGKTNLIKSFAEAIGGKSFIIPVKPNWTSSEDLLGYYNPLEKKYLATPFLEALLEAKNNPEIPYLICLDEMNLARVEYYFADFLSLLEERENLPEIKLYSDDESAHILSEFKNVMDTIKVVKEKYKKNNIVNFIELLQDVEINKELTRIFGFSNKDSFIKYHTDLRKMLNGILNTPSSIKFPKNVRIIGAINIDETTHYLSPKILDRAHIIKFDSPLLQDWKKIEKEIDKNIENKDLKVKLTMDDLGVRKDYPKYDRKDKFCKLITKFTKEYFNPLGIEVGLRTIRQGLNYQKIFEEQGSDKDLVLNNFILHKILPKINFDGNKKVNDDKKSELLQRFSINLKEHIDQTLAKEKSIDVIDELEHIIKVSESNDGIVNYWA